ncbi:MAG: RHS repeat-associated core domain-containing protein, partial [Planctomycetota bacterium]
SYYHQDNLGSTRLLTDEIATASDTFAYDAWGSETGRTGTTQTSFRWVGNQGYYCDVDFSTSYYIRARTYNSAPGRWLSVDPIGFVDGINRYRLHSILNGIDPSGLKCQGKPQGVKYHPNRGNFTVGQWLSETNNYYEIGAHMRFAWTWSGASEPFTDKKGCCCCTKIGFIQIGKYSTLRVTGLAEASDWFVDGGVPYPHSTQTNPCLTPGDKGFKEGNIQFTDTPNAPRYRGITPFSHSRVISFDHEFEVCAVCLEGNEGIVTQRDIQILGFGDFPAKVTTKTAGLTVYGCIRWSIHAEWDARNEDYVHDRYIETLGLHSRGTDMSAVVNVKSSTPGEGPSKTFIETVTREQVTSFPN